HRVKKMLKYLAISNIVVAGGFMKNAQLFSKIIFAGLLGLVSFTVFAANEYGNASIVNIAEVVTKQAQAIAKLLSVTAYVAGVGFSLAGVLQFKGHKENPQQIPLSKPVVMIVIAACLLYLPTVLNIAGTSVFG